MPGCTVFDGLQVTTSQTGATGVQLIYCFQTSGSVSFTVKNCIAKGLSGSGTSGIYLNNTMTGVDVQNNLIYDCGANGIYVSTSGTGADISNNTIENCPTALFSGYKDGRFVNNILFNSTTLLSGTPSSTSPYSRENYTDNASITYSECGSCGSGDELSASDPFTDLAGEDYSLSSATASGADLSSDFTDDIIGTTRSNWDKGAWEFVSSGGAGELHRRRRLQNKYLGFIEMFNIREKSLCVGLFF